MPAGFIVQIVNSETAAIEKELGPFGSERMAEKCEDGANINLDHERFHTCIVERREAVQFSESA